MQKEESDPSLLLAQQEGLRRRIQSAAAHRNTGPGRVTDVEESWGAPRYRLEGSNLRLYWPSSDYRFAW